MATGLSPRFPLSISSQGDFSNIPEVRELIKQNFKNLLLTIPGERIMIPDFGVGLPRFLFEFKNGPNKSISGIETVIKQQVSKYMPYIEILTIQVFPLDEDNISISLRIGYYIKPLSSVDQLEIR